MFTVPSAGPLYYLALVVLGVLIAPVFVYYFIQVRREKRHRRRERAARAADADRQS